MKKLIILPLALVAAPAAAADFSGPRIELHAGWDRLMLDGNEDGVTYGGGVGYDVDTGGALLGVEANVDFATTEERFGTIDAEAKRDISALVRVGFKLGEAALVYAKAGYTNLRVEAGAVSDEFDGVRVGAGVEVALSDSTYGKGEYRYSNYEAGIERSQVLLGIGVRF